MISSSSSPCSCSCCEKQRANFGLLFPGIQQPQPRAVQHVDHVVQRDAIQAGREPVEPLGGGRVAERVELLHFAQADGEDVDVRRLVDVLERFAQQPVALLFAVGGDDRDFADVGRSAVGVAADRERAVVGFDFQPTAGSAADDGRQVPFAARRRYAVQHRPHELHQRRFAGFVRPVEDRQLGRQPAQREIVPHAEAVDF